MNKPIIVFAFLIAVLFGLSQGPFSAPQPPTSTPQLQAAPVPLPDWPTAEQFAAWVAALPADQNFVVSAPIKLRSMRRHEYDFKNCQLVWTGPPDQSMFLLSSCDALVFKNLRVWADLPGVAAFDVTRSPGDPGGYTATACRWEGVEVQSTEDGFSFGYRVDHAIGGGPDANLDNMQWSNCWVNGVARSMWFVSGPQSMLHSLYRCGGSGEGRTKHCVESVNSYTIRVVGGGGNGLTDYAYQLGRLGSGWGLIDGTTWESCRGGLLIVPDAGMTPVQLSVRNNRYSQYGPSQPDTISFGLQVPAVEVSLNEFESFPDQSGKWTACNIRVRASAFTTRKGASVICNQNVFMCQSVGTTPATIPQIGISPNVPAGNQQTIGNQWWTPQGYIDRVRVVQVP